MNRKLARKIQAMFRMSEIATANKETIIPIYKVRENAEKLIIKENDLKEYLDKFAPADCQEYTPLILQKIFHPTTSDNQKDELLRLSLSE